MTENTCREVLDRIFRKTDDVKT